MLAQLRKIKILTVVGCLVPLLALFATYQAYRITLQTVHAEEKERFNWKSELIRAAIQERIDLISVHLRSIASHHAVNSNGNVNAFISDLALVKQFPELLAVGFVQSKDQKIVDLVQVRPRETKFRKALESNKDVQATLTLAKERGRIIASPRVNSPSKKNDQSPYFFLVTPTTNGWVLAAIDPKLSVHHALHSDGLKAIIASTDVELFEGDEAVAKYRLFDLHTDTSGVGEYFENDAFKRLVQLRFGQYVWAAFIGVRPGYLPNQARFEPRAVAIGGIVTSILLAILSATLLTTRNRALANATQFSSRFRESELRFRSLAEVVQVGIFETDSRGNLFYANTSWLKMTGMKPAEAVGEGWQNAIATPDQKEILQAWQLALETKSIVNRTFRLHCADTEERWVHFQSLPINRSNNETGFMCSWDFLSTNTNSKKANLAG